MTIAAAQKFIQQAVNDSGLIQRINAAPNEEGVREILAELGMEFNLEEFEMAYYNVLTWCQTHEQAEAVKEVKLWWDCLGQTFTT